MSARAAAATVLLAALALPAGAGAATVPERFAAGVKDFQEGRYEEAAQAFLDLHERFGVRSPDLLVDLGAAEYEAGRAGQALVHLHRAARLAPGSRAAEAAGVGIDRIRAALNQAGGRAGSKGGWVFGPPVDAPTALFGWADARVAGVAFLSVWLGLAVVLSAWRLARPGPRRRALGQVAAAAAVAAVLAGAVAWGSAHVAGYRFGVVVADGVGLYDDVTSVDKALDLPDGLELRVLEERGGFVRVRLASGREGWVPSDAVGVP